MLDRCLQYAPLARTLWKIQTPSFPRHSLGSKGEGAGCALAALPASIITEQMEQCGPRPDHAPLSSGGQLFPLSSLAAFVSWQPLAGQHSAAEALTTAERSRRIFRKAWLRPPSPDSSWVQAVGFGCRAPRLAGAL